MTNLLLPTRQESIAPVKFTGFVMALRGDPKFMEGVERGTRAYLEGRVKPWSQVKKELKID